LFSAQFRQIARHARDPARGRRPRWRIRWKGFCKSDRRRSPWLRRAARPRGPFLAGGGDPSEALARTRRLARGAGAAPRGSTAMLRRSLTGICRQNRPAGFRRPRWRCPQLTRYRTAGDSLSSRIPSITSDHGQKSTMSTIPAKPGSLKLRTVADRDGKGRSANAVPGHRGRMRWRLRLRDLPMFTSTKAWRGKRSASPLADGRGTCWILGF